MSAELIARLRDRTSPYHRDELHREAADALGCAKAWQPIETAPKDADVLLWVGIALGPPLIVQGCWYDYDDESGWIDHNGTPHKATHWMPLPQPPQ